MKSTSIVDAQQVLVVYPRGLQTGGPEALHQLVDSLRRQGKTAFLWPSPETRQLTRVPDYDRYDAPESLDDIDHKSTAVILHEGAWSHASRWRQATLCCWWLSIDNSTFYGPRRAWTLRSPDLPLTNRLRLAARVARAQARLLRHRKQVGRARHFTQSAYAAEYLQAQGWDVSAKLGDYIPDPPSGFQSGTRDRTLVVYNPKKGAELTSDVRERAGAIATWRPIENLDRNGVRSLLDSATVYIEAGHQPGKDRLPREAALHGCVVLMLKRGAGANDEDCPLPQAHKIDDTPAAGEVFAEVLVSVLRDPASHRHEQEPYVSGIRSEKRDFDTDVVAIFGSGHRP